MRLVACGTNGLASWIRRGDGCVAAALILLAPAGTGAQARAGATKVMEESIRDALSHGSPTLIPHTEFGTWPCPRAEVCIRGGRIRMRLDLASSRGSRTSFSLPTANGEYHFQQPPWELGWLFLVPLPRSCFSRPTYLTCEDGGGAWWPFVFHAVASLLAYADGSQRVMEVQIRAPRVEALGRRGFDEFVVSKQRDWQARPTSAAWRRENLPGRKLCDPPVPRASLDGGATTYIWNLTQLYSGESYPSYVFQSRVFCGITLERRPGPCGATERIQP